MRSEQIGDGDADPEIQPVGALDRIDIVEPDLAVSLARAHGADAEQLRRLNPVYSGGRVGRAHGTPRLLLPREQATSLAAAVRSIPAAAPLRATREDDISDAMADASAHVAPQSRTHRVVRGDSAWRIARRYGVSTSDLLARNGLDASSPLHPGMVLAIDTPADGVTATAVAE